MYCNQKETRYGAERLRKRSEQNQSGKIEIKGSERALRVYPKGYKQQTDLVSEPNQLHKFDLPPVAVLRRLKLTGLIPSPDF